jgi:hypothetical protein
MSSKLIAGNATNGSSLSADTSGILEIQTGSTPTTAITIDASQNLTYTGTLTGGTGVVNLGSGQFYKDASGNVGIGESSPSSYGQLTVTGSSASAGVNAWVRNTSDASADNVKYAGIQFSIGSDNGSTAIRSYRTNSAGDYSTAMAFFTKGNGANATIPTERMRIDSSGNLLVGTTSVPSGGQKMNIAGGITPSTDNSYIFGNSGLRWQALYAANGTIQTSDERDKTDIVDSPLGLDFICKVKPVAYKFKVGKNEVSVDEDGNKVITPIAGTRQHFGVLAQQVKEAVGDVDFGGWILTDTKKADSAQGIRYDEFVAPLIKAIQELNAKVDAQAAEIQALKGVA